MTGHPVTNHKLRLEIVTPERLIFSGYVDAVIATGTEGELGILPGHAPLMSILPPGELKVKQDGEETGIAIYGGFLEVRPDRVIVLADAAERVEEIDVAQAGEAKRRAERTLAETKYSRETLALAEKELRRSLVRLEIAEKTRKRKKPRPPENQV
jgi:F-type H+-transporting ATPase subunit epsilon